MSACFEDESDLQKGPFLRPLLYQHIFITNVWGNQNRLRFINYGYGNLYLILQ